MEQQEDTLVTVDTIKSLGRVWQVLAHDECSLESKGNLKSAERVHNETDMHTKRDV